MYLGMMVFNFLYRPLLHEETVGWTLSYSYTILVSLRYFIAVSNRVTHPVLNVTILGPVLEVRFQYGWY